MVARQPEISAGIENGLTFAQVIQMSASQLEKWLQLSCTGSRRDPFGAGGVFASRQFGRQTPFTSSPTAAEISACPSMIQAPALHFLSAKVPISTKTNSHPSHKPKTPKVIIIDHKPLEPGAACLLEPFPEALKHPHRTCMKRDTACRTFQSDI